MKKEEIHLTDWHRILLGQAPVEFLLEAMLRTLVVYLALGMRMHAQLSVMLMLGGIVSVPVQLPGRGILHGVLALAAW